VEEEKVRRKKKKEKEEEEGKGGGGRERRRRSAVHSSTFIHIIDVVCPWRSSMLSSSRVAGGEGKGSKCRPSRRFFVDSLHAGFLDVWAIVPQMWMSAFVPTFLAGFGNLPIQGRFYRIFQLIVMCFLFCRAGRVGGDP
jgi:hypothetical protein